MKQSKNDAVATVNGSAPLAVTDVPNMIQQINDDMSGAEVGMFKMLRAGIGLTAIKGMNAHGEWEQRMMELFPNKSPRTLQTYMQRAKPFLAEHKVSAEQAWAELSKLNAEQAVGMLLSSAQPKQIGEGEEAGARKRGKKDEAKPDVTVGGQPVTEMLMDFIQQRKKEKSPTPAKPLTKAERIKAAAAEAERVRGLVSDYIDDATYTLLSLEDLELAKSDLMSASGKLNAEIKAREAKGQK